MSKRLYACFLTLMLLLTGVLAGCERETKKEGVRLTADAVLPLSSELLLEPQEGYSLYCLVVTVENLGDYETPFSAPNDISFLPEHSVSILYGGYGRIGYKTSDIISPHGTAQLAVAFIVSDLKDINAIAYCTKQPVDESIRLPLNMDELLTMSESGKEDAHGKQSE